MSRRLDFFVWRCVSGFSTIVHLDLALPHSIYGFALPLRLSQIYVPFLCLVIPCMLMHNIRALPDALFIKLFTLGLLVFWSPSLFKGGTIHQGHFGIAGSILFLGISICALCQYWQFKGDRRYIARGLIAVSLLLFAINYSWWIPLFGLLSLVPLGSLHRCLHGRQRQIELCALLMSIAPLTLSTDRLTANANYLNELVSGERQLHLIEERTVEEYRSVGPLFNVPLRGMELTPKYPAFIERLDTSYANVFPSFTDDLYSRLRVYSNNPSTPNVEEIFFDGWSWRNNLEILRTEFPNVRFIATLPKFLCPGEEIIAEIEDTRKRRVVLIDVNRAYPKCK